MGFAARRERRVLLNPSYGAFVTRITQPRSGLEPPPAFPRQRRVVDHGRPTTQGAVQMGIDAGVSNPVVCGSASDPRVLRDAVLDAVSGGDAKRNGVTHFDAILSYVGNVRCSFRG